MDWNEEKVERKGLIRNMEWEGEEELRWREDNRFEGEKKFWINEERKIEREEEKEGNEVEVVRVNIGMNIEKEKGNIVLGWRKNERIRMMVEWDWEEIEERLDKVEKEVIFKWRKEIKRSNMELKERGKIEGEEEEERKIKELKKWLEIVLRKKIWGLLREDKNGRMLLIVMEEKSIVVKIESEGEDIEGKDRKGDGGCVERKFLIDIVKDLKWIEWLEENIVEEGEDGNVKNKEELKKFKSEWIDKIGRVDENEGDIKRCKSEVGVVGKILVERSVEKIEDEVIVLKGNKGGEEGNEEVEIDVNKVREGMDEVFIGIKLKRKMDREEKKKKILCKSGFKGVRVRDDRECEKICKWMVRGNEKNSDGEMLGREWKRNEKMLRRI